MLGRRRARLFEITLPLGSRLKMLPGAETGCLRAVSEVGRGSSWPGPKDTLS